MSDHISLTIPRNDAAALKAAAEMLNALVADILKPIPSLSMEETADPDAFAEVAFKSRNELLTDQLQEMKERAEQSGEELPPAEWGSKTAKEHINPQTTEGLPTSDASLEPPAAPSEPDPVPPAGVELDEEGLPWDMRIHAGTKTKTKSGVWKAKPGVDKQYAKQIKEELRKLMAIEPAAPKTEEPPATDQIQTLIDNGVTPQAAVAAASTVVPPPPPVEPITVAAGTLTYGGVSSAPPPPPEPAATGSDSPTDYPGFLKAAAVLIEQKRTDLVAINTLLNNKGIGGVNGLAQRPDLIPGVWAELQTVLK